MSASGEAVRLTHGPVRQMSAADLGVEPEDFVEEAAETPAKPEAKPAADPFSEIEGLADDDPYLESTTKLLKRFGGVIFTGPPGTSKSWYAHRIGIHLAERDPDRIRFVQFHPSYQYEDFVQGFVPRADGSGFTLEPKHLMKICHDAETKFAGKPVVLVIDELSRGEPGRIFGEALTYVERSKRNLNFHLASGQELAIPDNVVFLATMNPQDRGVDEVDGAFERRFAKIRMDPDSVLVTQFLTNAGMSGALRLRVEAFFTAAAKLGEGNPQAQLGHTFFTGVKDVEDLIDLWEHQLSFHFEKAFRLDPDGWAEINNLWNKVLRVPTPEGYDLDAGEGDIAASVPPVDAASIPGVATPTPPDEAEEAGS